MIIISGKHIITAIKNRKSFLLRLTDGSKISVEPNDDCTIDDLESDIAGAIDTGEGLQVIHHSSI